MHRAIKPHPHHLRNAASIVAVRLVDLRLQHCLHMPRFNADHRQLCFGESTEQPLRQRPSFQSNSLETVGGVRQHRQESIRFTRYLHFPHDPAVSSTMQTLVSLTETSSPAKWSMLRFSF